jgi:sulfotransferase family protein
MGPMTRTKRLRRRLRRAGRAITRAARLTWRRALATVSRRAGRSGRANRARPAAAAPGASGNSPVAAGDHQASGVRRTSGTARAMLPILVGGTGRSGTTIMGRLIGAHRDIYLLTPELKFLSARGSLSDLVAGKASYRVFEDRLLNRWFDRGPNIGIQRVLPRSTIEAELPRLRKGLRTDPPAAAGDFVHRLFDPIAEANGARGWAEMTPLNAQASSTLIRILPDMKLVHAVRDGRDVACSVVRVHWGPKDYDVALDWWARRLERAFARSAVLPEDQVLVVRLEDFVAHDRERQYTRLLEFLGLDDDPAMRGLFETSMTPDRAHIGRWREEVPRDRLAAFVAHHRQLAEHLAARGFPYRPEPDGIAAGASAEAKETVAV